jgi:hypothetical protein
VCVRRSSSCSRQRRSRVPLFFVFFTATTKILRLFCGTPQSAALTSVAAHTYPAAASSVAAKAHAFECNILGTFSKNMVGAPKRIATIADVTVT